MLLVLGLLPLNLVVIIAVVHVPRMCRHFHATASPGRAIGLVQCVVRNDCSVSHNLHSPLVRLSIDCCSCARMHVWDTKVSRSSRLESVGRACSVCVRARAHAHERYAAAAIRVAIASRCGAGCNRSSWGSSSAWLRRTRSCVMARHI